MIPLLLTLLCILGGWAILARSSTLRYDLKLFKTKLQAVFSFLWYNAKWHLLKRLPIIREPCARDTTLSTEWLSRVLRSSGVISASTVLKSATVEELAGGRIGKVWKVHIAYSSGNGPQTVVVKMSPMEEIFALQMAINKKQPRETLIYQIFQDEPAFFLPRVYYSWASLSTGMYLLVIEDLSENGTVNHLGKVLGKGCEGVENPPEYLPSKEEILHEMVRMCAVTHARFSVEGARLRKKYPWIGYINWMDDPDEQVFNATLASARTTWKAVRALIKGEGRDYGLKVSDLTVKALDEMFQVTDYKAFHRVFYRDVPLLTLVHGDYHERNIIYSRQKYYVIDWANCRINTPGDQMSYFLIKVFSIAMRRKYEAALLKYYYEHLIKNGVDAKKYSWDVFMYDYRMSGVNHWCQRLLLNANAAKDHAEYDTFFQPMADKVAAFLEDHYREGEEYVLMINPNFHRTIG